jgi:hypothetical protein
LGLPDAVFSTIQAAGAELPGVEVLFDTLGFYFSDRRG